MLQSSGTSITNHAVPYGAGLLGDPFPGTSCQATILQSLRDGLQPCKTSKLQAFARRAPSACLEQKVAKGEIDLTTGKSCIRI